MNIPMNFNMLNLVPQGSKHIDSNLKVDGISSNNFNLNMNSETKGDAMGIELNTTNSKLPVLNNENTNIDTNKEFEEKAESLVSSFEDILDFLIEKDEELKLNEDISFLQSIVALFDKTICNNDDKITIEDVNKVSEPMDLNSIKLHYLNLRDNESSLKDVISKIDTPNMDVLNMDVPTIETTDNSYLKNVDTMLNNVSNTKEVLENTAVSKEELNLLNNFLLVEKEFQLKENSNTSMDNNNVVEDNLILEFIQDCDHDFIENFKKVDNTTAKKDMLIEAFETFITNHEASTDAIDTNQALEDSYDAFKTTFKLKNSNNNSKNLEQTNLKLLGSNEIIELISNNNTFKINTNANVQESNNKDFNNFTIRQEMFATDLETSLLQMKNNNMRQLKIKLSPKELGDITIDISQVNNVSNIKLTLSNPDTLELVNSNLKEVVERLKESQPTLNSFNVTVETDIPQDRSFSSGFQSFSSGKKQNENFNSDNFSEDSENITIDTNSKIDNKNNILNILA